MSKITRVAALLTLSAFFAVAGAATTQGIGWDGTPGPATATAQASGIGWD